MEEGTLRQRRNLIMISCALFLIKYAGLEIHNFTFFNLSFDNLKRPEAIYHALIIMHLYFLVRYYQYFMKDGYNKLNSAINNDFLSQKNRYASFTAKAKDKNASYEWIDPDAFTSFHITVNAKHIWPVEIPFFTRKSFYLKAATRVLIKQTEFTDYILPFIISFTSLLYWLS